MMNTAISPLIDARTLTSRLGQPRLRVFDASVELPAPRFDGDYRVASGVEAWRAAHVPGSRHADLLHALADPQADFSFALPNWSALVSALQALGIDDDSDVVIYDRSDGFWAARLWWMLRSVGVHAQVLDGGWQAWRAAGLPEASGDATATEAGTITPKPRPELWADRRRVEAVVAGDAPGTLVCALSAALFAGDVPSRYARRGHIPGSRNLPARALFDADGRYLSPSRLLEVLAPLRETASRPLLLYCGGGISAAAEALALTLIGESEIAIYDGSLQEWAADPALPLVTLPEHAGTASVGAASAAMELSRESLIAAEAAPTKSDERR
jgi:thiosulfate/3-mercaptopyruvate sulfurtransferase